MTKLIFSGNDTLRYIVESVPYRLGQCSFTTKFYVSYSLKENREVHVI
jgi:hypothetical protein